MNETDKTNTDQAATNGQSNDVGNELNQETVTITRTDFDAMERDLAEAKEKADRYLRTVADLENIRRRLEKEKVEAMKFGGESILRDLLTVLDGFDKAFSSAKTNESADQAFLSGFSLVHKQLQDTLAKHGLEAINAAGTEFDPNIHQAIQRIEDATTLSDTVFEEFAKGYKFHGRLLRPAMVSVKVPLNPS